MIRKGNGRIRVGVGVEDAPHPRKNRTVHSGHLKDMTNRKMTAAVTTPPATKPIVKQRKSIRRKLLRAKDISARSLVDGGVT